MPIRLLKIGLDRNVGGSLISSSDILEESNSAVY
jgi:hypothetical protein